MRLFYLNILVQEEITFAISTTYEREEADVTEDLLRESLFKVIVNACVQPMSIGFSASRPKKVLFTSEGTVKTLKHVSVYYIYYFDFFLYLHMILWLLFCSFLYGLKRITSELDIPVGLASRMISVKFRTMLASEEQTNLRSCDRSTPEDVDDISQRLNNTDFDPAFLSSQLLVTP